MSYCPNCGGTNIKQKAFNLYNGGDYECADCEVEFYFGITKTDIYKEDDIELMSCEICKEEQESLNELTLDGTDDFYNLKVCDNCYEKYSDYFEPEEIDRLMRRKN